MLAGVYVARDGVPARQKLGLVSPAAIARGVPANVVLLGLTSLFTDVSSEMVSSILPFYAIFVLGLNPLQFGVLDGLYQGASALLRTVGGFVADRTRRHKEVAATGYAMSAAAKIGLLASGASLLPLVAVVLVDRAGKGIRTAPRDALISLSAEPRFIATAFGVHRALDTIGAFAGPIVALLILTAAPRAFDAVFVTSFSFALIGLGIITLFVRNRPVSPAPRPWIGGLAALRDRRFVLLTFAATVLALATASDGFLYLTLQRRLAFSAGIFPALSVITALIYFVTAVPAGRLADRIGKVPVFLGGYGLLVAVYITVLVPEASYATGLLALVLLGTYYACTDGVLAALASSLLPAASRASGLATLGTAVALARIVASVFFGALWSIGGSPTAITTFIALATVALVLSATTLRRLEPARAR